MRLVASSHNDPTVQADEVDALSHDLSEGEVQEQVYMLRDWPGSMVGMEAAAPDSRDAAALPLGGWFG